MEFALVGPHQGKTMKLGGFAFKNGVTEVPDEARDAQNLLQNHYSCYPSHMLENIGGKLRVKEVDGQPVSSLAAPPPLPEAGKAAPKEEALTDLSKAELKVKASELGLDMNGTKDDLVARIQEALAAKE